MPGHAYPDFGQHRFAGYPAQPADSTSACSSTVCVALSYLSGR